MASFVARIYRVLDALISGTTADAPTDLEVAVSGDDGSALEVNWTAPTDTGSVDIIDYYLIQWKTGDTSYTRTNQLDTTATSAPFVDLTEGATYTFRVAARTAAGLGEWSDEASGSPAVAPGPVGNLRSTPRNASLALSWTAPADDGGSEISGYVISLESRTPINQNRRTRQRGSHLLHHHRTEKLLGVFGIGASQECCRRRRRRQRPLR